MAQEVKKAWLKLAWIRTEYLAKYSSKKHIN